MVTFLKRKAACVHVESFSKFYYFGPFGKQYEVVVKSTDSEVTLFSYPRFITCSLSGIDQVSLSVPPSLHLYNKSYNNI